MKDINWGIRREGRAWHGDEFVQGLDLTPEKMEANEGKLSWDDDQRMTTVKVKRHSPVAAELW